MRGSTHFLALAMFLVISINMIGNFHGVTAQFCQGTALSEIRAICDKSVASSGPEVPPSSECCSAMKLADLPCLCKQFTKEVEKVMSPKKVVDVARTCGVSAPAGLQCGSYKVPPAHA
ncbi:hypothetical protein K1719_043176 [Acacia pycnantha]|nr:hypothetical protein K1719_043176 [Acacia pycnantha]